ncbi:protein phosphatase 2C domain-containing protein [Nocardia sp. NPDC127526]|uniref:protein phosphatase 2C domain-containing protein n=1 Tax=Nocardia sp. NPDC127526 TaxID=3345393 RepID=UPI00362B50B7
MTARCPACGTFAAETDRFCEACGRQLGGRVALPPNGNAPSGASAALAGDDGAPPSTTVQPHTGTTLSYDTQPLIVCENCGGRRFTTDGYCDQCGQLGPQRDRFEADLATVSLITDRGIAHAHNEDAVAAAILASTSPGTPPTTVIAVCDGVSTSEDPQAASGAAVRSGVDACLAALVTATPAETSVLAGLNAAAQAVRDIGTPDGRSPSCTYVSAVVQFDNAGGAHITVANVGDSRAYWLQPGADGSRRLTADDSLAQALVDSGAMDEAASMNTPHAHVLTRWLGADGHSQPWSASCVRTLHTREPGVLLLCTDGLWNYLPDATALARIATASAPLAAARALVDYALLAGGKDNITVALVPISFSAPEGDAP